MSCHVCESTIGPSIGTDKLVAFTGLYLEQVMNVIKCTVEELCGKETSAREPSEMQGQSNADYCVSTSG